MRHSISLFIAGVLMIFIGTYMILCPTSFMAVALSVFAVYMIFDGVRGIVSVIRHMNFPVGIRSAIIGKSILVTGAGIVIIIMAIVRSDMLMPVFVYIAGGVFIIAGIINLIDCIVLSKLGMKPGYLSIEVLFLLLFGILLLLFPIYIGSTIITLFAAIIFAAGAVLITAGIYSIIFQRRIRSFVRNNGEVIPGHYDE